MQSDLLKDDILKDEKVLWSGRPEAAIGLRSFDAFMIPFSVLWCGFVIFWVWKVWSLSDESESYVRIIFSVFGLFFLLVGLYLLIGRFFWSRFKRERIDFFVTNKRVIVITRTFGKSVCAQFIDKIPCINKVVQKNGVGTIRFGNSVPAYVSYSTDMMDTWRVNGDMDVPVFYDIKDVNRVHEIINSMRQEK